MLKDLAVFLKQIEKASYEAFFYQELHINFCFSYKLGGYPL